MRVAHYSAALVLSFLFAHIAGQEETLGLFFTIPPQPTVAPTCFPQENALKTCIATKVTNHRADLCSDCVTFYASEADICHEIAPFVASCGCGDCPREVTNLVDCSKDCIESASPSMAPPTITMPPIAPSITVPSGTLAPSMDCSAQYVAYATCYDEQGDTGHITSCFTCLDTRYADVDPAGRECNIIDTALNSCGCRGVCIDELANFIGCEIGCETLDAITTGSTGGSKDSASSCKPPHLLGLAISAAAVVTGSVLTIYV